MKKIAIIGDGFSAYVTNKLFKNSIVLAPNFSLPTNNDFIRRKNLETHLRFKKIFNTGFYSTGNLKYEFKKAILHDSLIRGGHSNYWGGIINYDKLLNISKKNINKFEFKLMKLNYNKTFCFSNIPNAMQIQDKANNIFKTKDSFKNKLNVFVNRLFIEKGKVRVEFINEKFKLSSLQFDKIFIACGLPQTLDLFYRSNFLLDKNIITTEEYPTRFKISFSNKFPSINKTPVVKFNFLGLLKHLFFLRKESVKKFNILKDLIYVDQVFYYSKQRLNLQFDSSNKKLISSDKNNFGSSIHYCNTHINNKKLNSYLKNISKNLIGVSMPFVKQSFPGPISNDIINYIFKIKFN